MACFGPYGEALRKILSRLAMCELWRFSLDPLIQIAGIVQPMDDLFEIGQPIQGVVK
jgi:hypothetical protein